MQTQSRPILPSVKRLTFEPSAADNVIDLSAYNERGRRLYNERTFTMRLLINARDITQLQRRLSDVSNWLSGEGILVFDDLPEVVWNARIIDDIIYAPEIGGRKAMVTVNFVAEAFSCGTFNAAKGSPIGSKIPLSTKIPIGLPNTLTYTLSSSPQDITVRNIGSAPVAPVITIVHNSATTSYFGAKLGERSVYIWYGYQSQTTVIFDMEQGKITRSGDNTTLPSGGFHFFELAPGENTVTITAAAGDVVTVSYVPRFLYGWGG